MKIQQSNAITVRCLDIWPRTAQMIPKNWIVYFVDKTTTSHLIAVKKCALSVTRLVTKPKTAEKRMWFSVTNAIKLVTVKEGVLRFGMLLLVVLWNNLCACNAVKKVISSACSKEIVIKSKLMLRSWMILVNLYTSNLGKQRNLNQKMLIILKVRILKLTLLTISMILDRRRRKRRRG